MEYNFTLKLDYEKTAIQTEELSTAIRYLIKYLTTSENPTGFWLMSNRTGEIIIDDEIWVSQAIQYID